MTDTSDDTVEETEVEAENPLLGSFLLDDLHNHRILREEFVVYVGTDPSYEYHKDDVMEIGVEARMADRFKMNMNLLSAIDKERPILVELATCGGLWEEGMFMFDTILLCPNPVTVIASKWARSMSSIIPLAADKFVLSPSAQYMFHRGTWAEEGLDQEADTNDVERRKTRERMFSIYVERLKAQGAWSKWSRRRIRAELERLTRHKIDVHYSPLEAVRLGFVDEVFVGDWDNLRATKKNVARRNCMIRTILKEISVDVKVS